MIRCVYVDYVIAYVIDYVIDYVIGPSFVAIFVV